MEFIKDIHYYMDGTRVVLTSLYNNERGECGGNKCKHCPYIPKHKKGSVEMAEEFIKFNDKIENGNR
jgi:hypothetical protein